MTTVEPEFLINQATFYLTLLITIGSAGAIIWNVIRGINSRIKRNRDEQDVKAQLADEALRKYVEDRMKEVDEVKERVDFMYWKIAEQFFDERNKKGKEDGQSR